MPKKTRLQVSEELGAGPCGSQPDIMSLFKEELQTLSHALTGKLNLLEAAIQEVREGQTDIVRSLSFLDEKFEELKVTTRRLEKDNEELKAKNKSLDNQVSDLHHKVHDLDQYHRRINLELAGIPESREESPLVLALKVAQCVAPSLKESDIDIAHRRRARNAVYDGRKKLKNVTTRDIGVHGSANKFYVNENLTSVTRELLGIVNVERKKAGFKFVWTVNGKIFVRKDEKEPAIIIHTKDDIKKLK
ncbi:uncharacterized protein LOC115926216 [Strongylocentrotus purpuratus]|uniref:FP protein C-terminal domain-containing protein n=1 Tax=Strongylocentrotus purpuratus TaxID=7668 RepID=A0A7M7P5P9_STRPU|nr:uncharacterized protein LOC115926216 [Strongylocentrotus purpuratus]